MEKVLGLLKGGLLIIVAVCAFLGFTPVAQAQFPDPTTKAPEWAQKRTKSLIPELGDAVC